MPVLPDAAVLAGGEHDQAHERAGDRSPKCGPQRPAPSLASRTGTCGLGTSSSRLTLSVWSDYRKLEIESSGLPLARRWRRRKIFAFRGEDLMRLISFSVTISLALLS